jgi:hypothetical protein
MSSAAARAFREQALARQREEEARNNVLHKFIANSRALADANAK